MHCLLETLANKALATPHANEKKCQQPSGMGYGANTMRDRLFQCEGNNFDLKCMQPYYHQLMLK